MRTDCFYALYFTWQIMWRLQGHLNLMLCNPEENFAAKHRTALQPIPVWNARVNLLGLILHRCVNKIIRSYFESPVWVLKRRSKQSRQFLISSWAQFKNVIWNQILVVMVASHERVIIADAHLRRNLKFWIILEIMNGGAEEVNLWPTPAWCIFSSLIKIVE
jgi:hypothetical protein